MDTVIAEGEELRDEQCFFLPAEYIRAIESICLKMQSAQQELYLVSKKMKRI